MNPKPIPGVYNPIKPEGVSNNIISVISEERA